MLKTQMKKKLNKVTAKWLDTLPQDIRNAVQKDVLVCGGCFASFIQNEDPNDYDVYFTNAESCKLVADYYLKKIVDRAQDWQKKNVGIRIGTSEESTEATAPSEVKAKIVTNENGEDSVQCFVRSSGFIRVAKLVADKDYIPVCVSSNAITLSEGIQIITRFVGTPEQIIKNFDFKHTHGTWCSGTNELNIPEYVWECVANKTLQFSGSRYPVCSMFRIRKFFKRGWNINAGEMLKIAWKVQLLDLSNKAVLRDQLVGVDSAYFNDVIDALQGDAGEEILDENQLFKVIDKVFNF